MEHEIDPTHPLVRRLEAIRAVGATVGQITLTPLGREHLEEFVTDALHCAPMAAVPLAQLILRPRKHPRLQVQTRKFQT